MQRYVLPLVTTASLAVPLGLLAFESLLRLPGSNQRLWLAYHHVHHRRQHRPNERGNDKQPELADGPATHKPDFAVARHMARRNIIKSITYTLLYDTHRYM